MPVQIQVAAVGLEASVQQALERAGRNAKINLNVDAKGIQAISQPLGKITGQADEFSKSMEAANARVLAFGASVGILNSVVQAFKGMINVTVEVEARMADINSVFQRSTSELSNFKKEMFNVARETSTSFDTVSTAALELSRQGLAPVEVLSRLKDAMILSKLSGMDAAQSVEGLTAAINSFSKQGVTSAEVLNKVSAAAAKYAVSERDIIEGLKRAGPVAAQAGVSFEELGGIISAVQQKTARGGAVIGNAMKTIFTKIQDLGGLTQLEDLGVKVVDFQGKILPATAILDNLAQKMKNLSQVDLSVIQKRIGGGFQISPLIAALEDYSSETSVAKGATQTMMTATDQAYARMKALNETLAASMNKASVNLTQLGDQLGTLGIKNNMNDLLSFFNSLSSSITEALNGESIGSEVSKGLVKGIGSVLMSSGLPIILAIIGKLTFNLVAFGVQSLKSFFGIGSAAKEINALAGSLTNTLMNNKNIQQAVLSLEGNRVGQAKLLSEIMNQQLATAQKLAAIGSRAAPDVYQQTAGARKAASISGTAAGGYMPEVSKESSDIQRGVGGARSSDRPIVIPNFAFGGGRVGTMVANSSEHMVPNYKGSGGTAIFNRDMVAKIGLPSGARPVSAARGFVPNFAMKSTDIIAATKATTLDEFIKNPDISLKGKAVYYRGENSGLFLSNFITQSGPRTGELKVQRASAREEAEKAVKMEKAGLFNLDADQLGGIALVSPRFGKGVGDLSVEAPVSEIGFFNYDKEYSGISVDKNQFIKLNKVKTTNTPSGKDLQALQGDISNIFAGGVVELAQRLYGGTFDPASAGDFTAKLSSLNAAKKQELLPKSAQGELFEAAGKVALNTFKNMDSLFGASEQQRPFDFQNKKAIKQMFGIDAERGEAKRGGEKNFKGGKQAWSIVKKVFNDPAYNKKALESLKKQGMNMDYTKPPKEKAAEETATAAGGFVPNFVSQEYVLNTLQRIKNGTSGFSKQEQETFLAKFGGSASSGKGISLRQVFDHLDPDPSISPFVNKAYSSAGPMASTEQVFREFEKQIKSNPSALRNLVKGKGYIPNFADPLKEAISREVGAGVNPNQVYVDQHSSLKNSGNPMGLMVANRRDEPLGGLQGINRARKEGLNAQTYGAASGFVPNFATVSQSVGTSTGVGITTGGDADIAITNFAKSAQRAGANMERLSKSLEKKLIGFGVDDTIAKQLTEASRKEVESRKSAAAQSRASVVSSILGDDANKKLKSTIEKQIDAYNKSAKSAADLAALQSKMAQSASKAGLSGSQTKALSQSASTLAGERQQSSDSKPQGDFLGTIFAVQAGFSLLAGATGEATEGFYKYVSVLSSGLSNLSTVAFAFQGFSQMAKNATGAFGKVIGNVGIYGAALMAGYEVFKLGKELYNEYTGANKRAAEASNLLAKSAENASMRLDSYSPTAKKDIESKADALIKNLQEGRIDLRTGKYIENATKGQREGNRVTIDDVNLPAIRQGVMGSYGSGKELNDITKTVISSLSRETTQSLSGNVSRDLDINTLSVGLDKLSKNPELEKLKLNFEALKKGNPEELISQGKIKNPDRLKSFDTLNESQKLGLITSVAKQSGAGLEPTKKLFAEYEAFLKNRNIEEKNYEQLVSVNLQKVLKNLSIESALREALNAKSRESITNELSLQKSINDAMNDQSLSQDDRNKKIKQLELSSKNTLSIIENQKNQYKEISDLTDKLSEVGFMPAAKRPIVRENLQTAINGLNPDKIASLGADLGSTDPIKFAQAELELKNLINQSLVKSGLESKNILSLEKDMLGQVIQHVTARRQANIENDREIAKSNELLSIDEDRLDAAKSRAQLFSKLELGFSSKIADRELGNIKLQGQASRVDLEKQIKLATPGTFKGVTDPREILAKTQAIERAAFEEKRKLDLQAQIEQIKIETDRAAYTEKNITALGQNTEAINKLTNAALNPPSLASSGQNKNGLLGVETPAISKGLIDRSKIPELSEESLNRLGKLMTAEVGGQGENARLAFAETVFNRSQAKKVSVEDTIKSKAYYSSYGNGSYDLAGVDPKIKEIYDKIKAGSNITGGMTDNGSGSVGAREAMKYSSMNINGETFSNQYSKWNPQMISQNAGILSGGEGNAATKLAASGKSGDELVAAAEKAAAELGNKTNEAIGDSAKRLVDAANKMRAATLSSEETTKSKELDQALERLKATPGTFSQGMEKGMVDLKQQQLDFSYNMGQQLPKSFADNMATAMDAIILKGENFGDSLRNAATSFLGEMNKAMIGNLAKSFTSGLGNVGSSIMSSFGAYAAGGKITGGSGVKDDVPSMLMGGEFVMNKRSVAKYGTGFMEQLNNGSLQHFASGGEVESAEKKEKNQRYSISSGGLGSASSAISGKNLKSMNQTGEGGFFVPGLQGSGNISGKQNLMAFAGQAYTLGSKDIMTGGSGSSAISLEGESIRLTNFGRNQGPMAQAIKESKGQALDLYQQQLKREAEIKAAHKAQVKAFQNQLKMAVIQAAVSIGGGAVAKGMGAGWSQAAKSGAGLGGKVMGSLGGAFQGGNINGVQVGGLSNLFSGNFALSQIGSAKELDRYMVGSNDMYSPGYKAVRGYMGPTTPMYMNTQMRATGGQIPNAAGVDTVPAMLSGGEFIMNSAATQKIGVGNLNAMNSGVSQSTGDSKDLNDKLIAKLDELIKASKEGGKGVTVNVTSDGKKEETKMDKGSENTSEKERELSRKIKAAVIQVIQDEKRLGGTLRRS